MCLVPEQHLSKAVYSNVALRLVPRWCRLADLNVTTRKCRSWTKQPGNWIAGQGCLCQQRLVSLRGVRLLAVLTPTASPLLSAAASILEKFRYHSASTLALVSVKADAVLVKTPNHRWYQFMQTSSRVHPNRHHQRHKLLGRAEITV